MIIQINTEKLKELNPCVDRYRNWLEHYSEFCGSFNEFLDLDKITYDDKIFVIKKLVPKEVLVKWAILCAESVLHFFERKFPNDKRPRDCIAYLKTGEKNIEKLINHKKSAYAAAAAAADYNAATDTAYAAAYAANAAYAYAADAAYAYADDSAVTYAAAYAAAAAAYSADAAAYAADAAYSDDDARLKQKNKNLEFLKSLLNNW